MEQTAVEWLVSNIDWILLRNCKHQYKMIIEQAMEHNLAIACNGIGLCVVALNRN